MRYSYLFLWCAVSLLSCTGDSPKTYTVVVTNTTVLDVRNKKEVPNQNLYIRDGRIVKISPATADRNPRADTLVDGTGKYLSPGLWDMHAHITWKPGLEQWLYPILFSHGITGVRDMGGDLKILKTLKNQCQRNPASSPVIFGPGPILDGSPPLHPDVSVGLNAGNTVQVLDSLVASDVDFLKVYSLLPEDILGEIAQYGKENNIDFSGHISEYTNPEKAIALGQKTIEHLNVLEALVTDSLRLASFVEQAKSAGTWFCPTLIVYQRSFEHLQLNFTAHPLLNQLDPDLASEWEAAEQRAQSASRGRAEIDTAALRWERQKKLVRYLYDQQLPMVLGTDFAGMPYVYPGFSLHEEMALLQELGMEPFDILQMGTYNAAVLMGASEEFGYLASGKSADVVIFNANPAEDIRNSLEIHSVLRAGQWVGTKMP